MLEEIKLHYLQKQLPITLTYLMEWEEEEKEINSQWGNHVECNDRAYSF